MKQLSISIIFKLSDSGKSQRFFCDNLEKPLNCLSIALCRTYNKKQEIDFGKTGSIPKHKTYLSARFHPFLADFLLSKIKKFIWQVVIASQKSAPRDYETQAHWSEQIFSVLSLSLDLSHAYFLFLADARYHLLSFSSLVSAYVLLNTFSTSRLIKHFVQYRIGRNAGPVFVTLALSGRRKTFISFEVQWLV